MKTVTQIHPNLLDSDQFFWKMLRHHQMMTKHFSQVLESVTFCFIF